MQTPPRSLSRRQSYTDLNQVNQFLEDIDFFPENDELNPYYGTSSEFENDHPKMASDKYNRLSKTHTDNTKQDYSSDSLTKKPSITESTRQRDNSFYHNIPKTPSRCHSLTDLTKSTSSIESEASTRDNVISVSNGTIEICFGDITKQAVDAIIVASTSDYLTKNVLKEAGEPFRAMYSNEIQRKRDAPICTDNGNLACKRIYFIPCAQLSPGADKSIFRKFISEATTLAAQDSTTKIQSLALPAIGCGQYGCDSNFVAKTLLMAVAYELERQSSLRLHVRFIIQQHEQKIFDVFRNELKAMKSNGSTYKTTSSRSSDTSMLLPSGPSRPRPYEKKFVIEKRPMDESSNEYTKVINEFWSTMESQHCSEILRIELVWNERWYKQYLIHKHEFDQRLQSDTEEYLFHGCSESAANSIIKGCFNRSYAGKNGVVYGHGVYFSSRASYSHSYATANEKGERCMFLAKVLIGKTILGNSSMKHCPIGYDTTTDGSHIYVVYHDAQAFGHYLITYK